MKKDSSLVQGVYSVGGPGLSERRQRLAAGKESDAPQLVERDL